MLTLRQSLSSRLEGAQRVAVLAVGSRLRGDDAAGLLAADRLARSADPARMAIFMGETAPENLTGEIKRYQPTHLVILDAADMGKAPGHAAIVMDYGPGGDASFSTHRLPLMVLTDYLHHFINCQVILLGIQPAGCGFGQPACPQVRRSARRVADALAACVAPR